MTERETLLQQLIRELSVRSLFVLLVVVPLVAVFLLVKFVKWVWYF